MGNDMSVRITNMYSRPVWCRLVGDKRFETSEQTETGVGIQAAGSLTGKFNTEVKWELAGQKGFTKVKPGVSLEFSAIADKNRAFLTIYMSKHIVCYNFAVLRKRNFIIDEDGFLREARWGKVWKAKRFLPKTVADNLKKGKDDDQIVDPLEDVLEGNIINQQTVQNGSGPPSYVSEADSDSTEDNMSDSNA